MKIYIFPEGSREPNQLEVAEDATMEDVLNASKHLMPVDTEGSDFNLFMEDEAEFDDEQEQGQKRSIKPKDRIQCHRCPHVDVELVYNGTRHQVEFKPSATGAKILSRVPKIFKGISPKDAANLRLQISEDKYIENNEHLGSFVAYPHCHIKIKLVPKTNVQG